MALNLPKLISKGVAMAHNITESAQVIVKHYPWIRNDQWGKPTYDTVRNLKALYEQRLESRVDTGTGKVIQTKGKLTFLDPIPPHGAAGRVEPIDNRDRLILPDGTTGPIFKPEGLMNPDTNRPYMIELWLGL